MCNCWSEFWNENCEQTVKIVANARNLPKMNNKPDIILHLPENIMESQLEWAFSWFSFILH